MRSPMRALRPASMDAAAPLARRCLRRDAITVAGVSKWFKTADGQPLHVLQDIELAVSPAFDPRDPRCLRLRQEHAAQHHLGYPARRSAASRINGVPQRDFTDWRSVSYIFQEDRLLPWRTALRNVEFALEAGSTAARRAQAPRAAPLELVGLTGFDDAFPYQLSGGMRSRVALARSLVLEPCILLMDEPFSRLDAQTRSLMHDELLRIHGLKRMTIVFVTHDVEESVVLADRVVVMAPRPGRVRETWRSRCRGRATRRARSDALHPAAAGADLKGVTSSDGNRKKPCHLHLETSRKRAALFHLTEEEWAAAAKRHRELASEAPRHHRLGRRHPRRGAPDRRRHDQLEPAEGRAAQPRAAAQVDTDDRRGRRRAAAARLAARRHRAHEQPRRARRQSRGFVRDGACSRSTCGSPSPATPARAASGSR